MAAMRILLIRANAAEQALADMSRSIPSSCPPLGILYLSSYLKQHGHEVRVLDDDSVQLTSKEFLELLDDFKPNLVGFTVVSVAFASTVALAALVKANSDAQVIIGGPHASATYASVLEHYPMFDIVVRGEGEYPLLALADGKKPAGIKGISFRSGGVIVHNPAQPRISDLDSLPYPDLDAIDLKAYRYPIHNIYGYPLAPVVTGRGCPYDCSYCASKTTYGRKVIFRKVEKVLEQIEWMKNRYDIGLFHFWDDTFTLNKKRFLLLCRGLEEMKIHWSCYIRVDTVNLKILTAMRRAGCLLGTIGVESGDDHILKSLHRDSALTGVLLRAFHDASSVGIATVASFIIGLPEDDRESIERTLAFSKELRATYAWFFPLVPYPGTEIYDWAKAEKRLVFDRWEDLKAPKYTNVAIRHPLFSGEEILAYVRRGYREFYLRPSYLRDSPLRAALSDRRAFKQFIELIYLYGRYFLLKQ